MAKIKLLNLNNEVPVIQTNLKMTNGYIHVISGLLQKSEISGYNWLQQHDDYSILAKAMEISGIKKGLWWNKYTILAENDSIYNRNGIYSVEDLISRIATPGISLTDKSNAFYRFVGYHIVGGEFFLNDLSWGNKKYTTLGSTQLTIDVGFNIRINPGVDTYGIEISESGDTTVIDCISPVEENCNLITTTGPIHSISEVLYFNHFPK